MKIFSPTLIAWNEPWFFLLRIREAWGWRRRLLLALGVSVLMICAIYFFGQGKQGPVAAVATGVAAGFVLVALLDVPNIQREVTIKDDCVIVNSAVHHNRFWVFKFDQILAVRLTRPRQWGKPYSGMVLELADDAFLVAAPAKVSLETVANILHRLNVTVTLDGWEPSASDTRIQVSEAVEIDPSRARGEMELREVSTDEPKLMSPWDITVQVVVALGPAVLALITLIAAGAYLVLRRAELSWLDMSMIGGAAVAFFIISFVYLVMVGQFLAAAYGVRVGSNRLALRTQALVEGSEPNLLAVEIFDRESWTATIVKSSDYGFLKIDRAARQFLYEGNKTRWTLPYSALTACRIEESIVGSEGNTNPEKRYYVVLAANQAGAAWEVGMIFVRTEIGRDNAETRRSRARLLFTQLAEAL